MLGATNAAAPPLQFDSIMTTPKSKTSLLCASLALSLAVAAPASARPSLWKSKKAPVTQTARSFSVPKAGEEAAKNQDAFASDTSTGRYAVADGVSRSAHPREWATLLAESFVKEGPEHGKLVEWMSPLRGLWKKKVDAKLEAKKPAAPAQRVEVVVAVKPAAGGLSLFEDFASSSVPKTQDVEAPKSAADELMAELSRNPGQLKKTHVVEQKSGDTDAGAELLAWISKEKTETKGASATLLGLEVRPAEGGKVAWRSTALKDGSGQFSDSVVFQVRKRSGVFGWIAAHVFRKGKLKTVDHWPPLEEKDFATTPAQLRTRTDADGAVALAVKDGVARRGDQLVMTTDAVGKWIMAAKGRERSQRLQKLLDARDQAAFGKLIDAEREGRMGNDDSTVTVIDLR
jgi:hypothetical protein